MSVLYKWILGLAGTSAIAAVSYHYVDRPVALFFHEAVGRPEPLAKLTYMPDVLVPLAATVLFVAMEEI